MNKPTQADIDEEQAEMAANRAYFEEMEYNQAQMEAYNEREEARG